MIVPKAGEAYTLICSGGMMKAEIRLLHIFLCMIVVFRAILIDILFISPYVYTNYGDTTEAKIPWAHLLEHR